jgi:drug/metabolite transporter (DMT)-like permease
MAAEFTLALCGAGGALMYAAPVYIKGRSRVPPAQDGLLQLALALFAGALCAAVATQFIGHKWPWTVEPKPFALAVMIGLACHSAIPVLIHNIVKALELLKFGEEKG